MEINLELWEVNLILKALGKQPYEEVVETIQRIKDQAEKNVSPSRETIEK